MRTPTPLVEAELLADAAGGMSVQAMQRKHQIGYNRARQARDAAIALVAEGGVDRERVYVAPEIDRAAGIVPVDPADGTPDAFEQAKALLESPEEEPETLVCEGCQAEVAELFEDDGMNNLCKACIDLAGQSEACTCHPQVQELCPACAASAAQQDEAPESYALDVQLNVHQVDNVLRGLSYDDAIAGLLSIPPEWKAGVLQFLIQQRLNTLALPPTHLSVSEPEARTLGERLLALAETPTRHTPPSEETYA